MQAVSAERNAHVVHIRGGRKRLRDVAVLSRLPRRIEVAGDLFDRVDDPETGEFLGVYVGTF